MIVLIMQQEVTFEFHPLHCLISKEEDVLFTNKENQNLEQFEIIDLGIPSPKNSASRWLTSRMLYWQRSPHWRHWKLASYLAFAILLVIFCFLKDSPFAQISSLFQGPPSSAASIPAHSTLQEQSGLACLVDVAWSPDKERVAVLGYRQGCGQISGRPALVNLYAPHHSRLRQFSPDRAIFEVLYGSVPPSQKGRIYQEEMLSTLIVYTHVLWSPDGHRLAVAFSLPGQGSHAYGMVLMTSSGADLQVLITQSPVSDPFSQE